MGTLKDAASLEAFVRQAVAAVTVTDIHTHLFPPAHDGLLLWGVDELLIYHYLMTEMFMVAPRDLTPEKFWRLQKREQADLVWRHVFLEHGPLSEAARGLLGTLSALGMDVGRRDLGAIRRWFGRQKIESYLPRVFKMANIEYAVMTNNPFAPEEARCWERGLPSLDCFKTALRIDTLILQWPEAAKTMRAAGYKTAAMPNAKSFAAARKFLADWAERLKPVYLAASLPPDFVYPSKAASARVMREVILPAARELNLPVAMMIGVRKRIHPALGDGGDGVGIAHMETVEHLCRDCPDVKFLVTVLSRVNHHELCVLARKFNNLHVFGCWWFCNTPSIIEEVTRMRLELLGTAFTCQHSDARVLDQLIYKWSHARSIVAKVLADKVCEQFEAGWRPTEEEVRRDVRSIFGGSFKDFIEK